MATANSYIRIGPNTYQGSKVLQLHEQLRAAMELATEIANSLSQAASNDPSDTNGLIATLLGTGAANDAQAVADAVGVRNLVGSINSNLENASNAFIQFRDRIGPNF